MTLSRPGGSQPGGSLQGRSRRRRPGPGPSKRSEVAPFLVMEIMAEAARLEAEGRRVIHLQVGQPGTPAPAAARAALAAALAEPLGYTVALGRDDLRRAIAAHYAAAHGIDLDPARVIVTTGSSAAFQLAFLALFEPGARLLMADPGYPSYRSIARALGVEPVGVAAAAETGFQPTPDDVAAAGQIDGVLAASPANPTGSMLSPTALAALIHATEDAGGVFISDEIYHGLTYSDVETATALSISDEAVVINSFSKYFSMTGWRIGWMVVPERLIRPVERLAQNLFICSPHASQIAAHAALSDAARPELEAAKAVYAQNRRVLLERLPAAGVSRFAPPDGAFYLYADISDHTDDALGWCRRLLDEHGVAATPGVDFDPLRGGRFVRFSFAGALDAITEGAERIEAFLRRG